MVSQPQSGQKKTTEQWRACVGGVRADSESFLSKQIHDMERSHPTNGREEESKAGDSEEQEKSFVSSLYSFMKERATPIERIPHLGFKQINLWRIYKAVEKLGGYDCVTAQRLWKNVYDELGGSPGSTSAATCTRRHYERLVLPFERHIRGEEDKPLPPAKPRKQYKKSLEGKSGKPEAKRKRSQPEGEGEGEGCPEQAQGKLMDCSPCETGKSQHSARQQQDCCRPESEAAVAKEQPAMAGIVSQPGKSHFTTLQASAGEVISPLEKKKRMAQASLGFSVAHSSPELDNTGRPSVIHCAQSPGLPHSGRTRESSEGSPIPHSSSSSRSPSPCSVSSDDCAPVASPEKPAPSAHASNLTSFTCCSGVCKPVSCSTSVKDSTSHLHLHRNAGQLGLLSTNPAGGKGQTADWNPSCRGESGPLGLKTQPPTLSTSAEIGPKACWVSPQSSFTKVLPKSVEHLAPSSFQPGHKHNHIQKRLHPEEVLTYGKKLQMVPPLHYRDAKERSKLALPKPLPTQHTLVHPQATLPISYLFPAYERTRPVSAHQHKGLSLHPLIPTHLAVPSQPSSMYRHVMAGSSYTIPYETLPRPRPYQIPLWHPQAGYAIAGLNPHYPNTKL
ncbi:hypothetical protein GJAV_G00032340 [Gymnothorax javanicus]|nr:hypothetical protein GJAV_G00032340 [Gymnothorax javanicus]